MKTGQSVDEPMGKLQLDCHADPCLSGKCPLGPPAQARMMQMRVTHAAHTYTARLL